MTDGRPHRVIWQCLYRCWHDVPCACPIGRDHDDAGDPVLRTVRR